MGEEVPGLEPGHVCSNGGGGAKLESGLGRQPAHGQSGMDNGTGRL